MIVHIARVGFITGDTTLKGNGYKQCDCFSILCCPLDKSCGDNEDADHDNESHQSESDYGNKLTAMIEMKTLNMAIMVKAILTSGQIRGHKYKYTNVTVY